MPMLASGRKTYGRASTTGRLAMFSGIFLREKTPARWRIAGHRRARAQPATNRIAALGAPGAAMPMLA
jgi:hypothetical protein